MDASIGNAGSASPLTPQESTDRIGPYRVLRVLGEGGMGIVYEAEQTAPVHRRVALKMLLAGLDSGDVLARFEAERQALAVMDHPNIAKVLDAGATQAGLPYFVMELVKGVALAEYCDAHRLGVRDRATLFIDICRAIQHAHQKGVIHRDLKPSNILVTEDQGARPKVIDFGIAKAVAQRLTERTLVTAFGQSVGTPAYMSPEQAEASGLDVDTRTDIYSLGVMLYELLVGRLPVDPAEMGLPNFIVSLTMRQSDPPKPSTRLTQVQQAAAVASLRGTDVVGLRRQLRGDLDWIVMKAMEPERNRRYETANGLAQDLERFLADEPVTARPPSARYRLGKFARRNRAAVIAAGLVAASLVGGASLAVGGMVRANRAEVAARRDAAAAAQISNFLVGLFATSNPNHKDASTRTVREVLDSGAARVASLRGQPAVQVRLLRTMGRVYTNLGLFAPADTLLRQALALSRAAVPVDSGSLAESLVDMGRVLAQEGKLAPAESTITASLAIQERMRPPNDSVLSDGYYELGRIAMIRDDPKRLRELTAKALAYAERSSADPAITRRLNVLTLIANSHVMENRYDTAAMQYRAILAVAEPAYGLRSSQVIGAMVNLALTDRNLGRYAEAESLLTRVVPPVRDIYGPNSSRTSTVLTNLGQVYAAERRWVQAEATLREAIAIDERVLDPASPDLASDLRPLADVLAMSGRPLAADSLYRRVLAIQRRALAPDSRDLRETDSAYAVVLRALGRTREADALTRTMGAGTGRP
ncbi:MAG TPA: serine/threonine-protein kinase [Gemmatimonadaceae bacterium]|nr:serine/threonine-protein kinase [Gemmatimonadaceae bacterium]